MKSSNPLQGVLLEELANSQRMRTRYQAMLRKLPKGALVEKTIKGSTFHYLVLRRRGKVHFAYQGRLDAKAAASHQAIQKRRADYRRLISDLNRQILFLTRALHVRKRRSV